MYSFALAKYFAFLSSGPPHAVTVTAARRPMPIFTRMREIFPYLLCRNGAVMSLGYYVTQFATTKSEFRVRTKSRATPGRAAGHGWKKHGAAIQKKRKAPSVWRRRHPDAQYRRSLREAAERSPPRTPSDSRAGWFGSGSPR